MTRPATSCLLAPRPRDTKDNGLKRWFVAAGLMLALVGHEITSQAAIGWGQVVDAATCRPIEGAVVTVGASTVRTDAAGVFTLPAPAAGLHVRAPGYGKLALNDSDAHLKSVDVRLQPFTPKALYLSFFGIGDLTLRSAALKLIEETELNALVIDVKGDRGRIPYPSSVALASEVGAQKIITVHNIAALLNQLHDKGVYTIARVVAFKDDPLARAHPELAVHDRAGGIWSDREGLAWTDPFQPAAREYVLAVAEEAARLGFDEIQFDYLRFPDDPGLVFSKPSNETNRVASISGFVAEASRRLAPYNVFVAADIFGYVLWNRDDTAIGQRLEDLAPHLDYISPMLYPTGFQFGIPGYSDPVAHPYEIVALSLRNAQKRTGLPGLRFRPWLQAFRDYAFDRRAFGTDEIAAQTRAADEFGSNGWMLWNPRNLYTNAGLKKGGVK